MSKEELVNRILEHKKYSPCVPYEGVIPEHLWEYVKYTFPEVLP